MKLIRSKNILIGLSIVFFALGYYLQFKVNSLDYTGIAADFEYQLQEKESILDELLEEIDEEEGTISFDLIQEKKSWFESVQALKGFSVMVFEEDSLVLWTDNNVSFPDSFSASHEKPGLRRLKNGWYDVRIITKGQRSVIGFILIKREYPFENRFLSNEFTQDFDLPRGGILTELEKPKSVPIFSIDGATFGYLSFDEIGTSREYLQYTFIWLLAIALLLLGLLMAIIYLEHLISLLNDHFGSGMVSIVFIISVVALRVLMIWNKFPGMLYELPIFSPSYYGTSSFFPSLGDFFLNGVTICALAYYVQKKSAVDITESATTVNVWEYVKLTAVLLLAVPLLILIEGLVKNSSISYNINNFYELNYMSFIGLISIGLFLFSYHFIAEAGLKRLGTLNSKRIVLIGILAIVSFTFICVLLAFTDLALIIWTPVFIGILMFKNYREQKQPNEFDSKSGRLYPMIALIVIGAIFTSHSISHSHTIKELEERKILAQKLAVETDPVAEYMYGELESALRDDPTLIKGVSNLPEQKESLLEHISDRHLRGFWEKYDVQITVCEANDSLILQDENRIVPCLVFFEEIIKSQGDQTMANNFHYLDNNNGRVSYLGILDVEGTSFILEFDSKIIPEELGFPELLLDLEVSEHLRDALKYYSYAKFKDGKLSSQSGEYPFSGKLPDQKYENEYA
ncbi:MAG: hypothetical protein JKX74_05565, partial [Flavobacteriales bacterium]|nr:hypothetical protein [Flavobacteriales bacterium]